MTQSSQQVKSTPRPFLRATAHRCAHCRRELPTGEGRDVPFIGVVGPECVKKYASLEAALMLVNGLEAHEWDRGTIVLADRVIRDLRGIGVSVRVVDTAADIKTVQIMGLARQPKAVIASWKEVREQFELRLKLAAAEREVAA